MARPVRSLLLTRIPDRCSFGVRAPGPENLGRLRVFFIAVRSLIPPQFAVSPIDDNSEAFRDARFKDLDDLADLAGLHGRVLFAQDAFHNALADEPSRLLLGECFYIAQCRLVPASTAVETAAA